MTILLCSQELQREIVAFPNRIVIPTGAKRSGGTCGFFPWVLTQPLNPVPFKP
jgi:hypothetical protein